jgi:FMN phosphatase YigB (HAD superfamily)
VRSWGLPLDLVGTSAGWDAEKPDPAFFDRLVTETGARRDEVLYVGDRLDNDVRAGQAAGLQTVFVRRGPWAHVLQDDAALAGCLFAVDSLAELPRRLADLGATG